MNSPSQTSSFLQRLAAAAAAWQRRQRDRQQLMAMSEAELRDLGIGRSQVPGLTGLTGPTEVQITPAARNSATRAASRPMSRSTSSVCWPSAGGARRSTGGVA